MPATFHRLVPSRGWTSRGHPSSLRRVGRGHTALHVAERLAAESCGRKAEVRAGWGLWVQSHQELNCHCHRQQQNLQTSLSDTGGQTTLRVERTVNNSGHQCQADNVGITEENNRRGQGPPVCSLQLSPLGCLPPPGSIRPKVKPEGTQMSHNWESSRGVEMTVGWLATQVWSSKERSGQKYMDHQRTSSGRDEPQDSPRFPYYTAPRTLPQHNCCHIIVTV